MSQSTIKHIASLAQVSRSTVSRVLNEHPSVRPEVRDRVLRVISEQGYAPQAAARSLASRRTNMIGLLIPRSASVIFSDPFFPRVIQSITETCSSRGYFLMLSMVSGIQEEDFCKRILRSRPIDGLIMLSSDIDDPILPMLMKDALPLVLIGHHPYLRALSWVDVDNCAGALMGVNHLLGLGHRRIATITGPLQMSASMDRRDGYKQALMEAGLPIEQRYMVEGDFTQESGYAGMNRLLGLDPRPTAVFFASDMMAFGAMRAIHEAGLRIPHDVALVGFDDIPMAGFVNPPLTTLRQPMGRIGATAAALLIDHLEGVANQVNVLLDTELVVRQSSGPHRP